MTFGANLSKRLTRFLRGEDGAVTADWVVLAAAVCLLSVPVLTAVLGSVDGGAKSIAAEVVEAAE